MVCQDSSKVKNGQVKEVMNGWRSGEKWREQKQEMTGGNDGKTPKLFRIICFCSFPSILVRCRFVTSIPTRYSEVQQKNKEPITTDIVCSVHQAYYGVSGAIEWWGKQPSQTWSPHVTHDVLRVFWKKKINLFKPSKIIYRSFFQIEIFHNYFPKIRI